jgi:hypothetical protein
VVSKPTARLGDRPEGLWAAGLLTGWSALAAFCCWGVAPAVDLPAHAAHLETLAGLLRGEPLLSSVYAAHFVPGYGLLYWLALPVAAARDGATAVRVAAWLTLEAFALAVLLLLRALRRPPWTLLLALPLAFNVSYWYGFLPFAFASALGLLTLAALARWVSRGGRGAASLFVLGMSLTFLAHLPVSGVLLVAAWTVALALPVARRRPTLRLVAVASAGPLLLLVPAVWGFLQGAHPAPSGRTDFDGLSHLNWFFHNYRPEGRLAWTLPLGMSAVFLGLFWRRRRLEPRAPFAVFCALAALYLLTPRHVVGASHLAVRLPALVALAALLAADARALPRWLALSLGVLSVLSLAETAAFHLRFRAAVSGLDAVTTRRPEGRHAFQPLGSDTLLGSKLPYLYHLGSWVTAAEGGVGNDFFVGNPQEPLRYRPGEALPSFLRDFTPAQRAQLEHLYLFGPPTAPVEGGGFCEAARAGGWRRMDRCPPG